MIFLIILTALFLVFPVVMMPINYLLMNFLQDKSKYFFMFLFICGLGMFGTHFEPNGLFDIIRYKANLVTLQQVNNPLLLLDSSKFTSYGFTIGLDTNVLFTIYSWIIAKTGHPNLISFFSIFIVYGSLLYPALDIEKKINSFTLKLLLNTLMITSIPMVVSISAIRWPMAAALYILTTYLYFVKIKRPIYIWLLLIPVLMHSSLMILSLSTILIAIFNIKTFKTTLLLWIISIVVFPAVFYFLQNISNTYIQSLLQKFDDYSQTSLSSGAFIMNNGTAVISIVMVMFMFLLMTYFRRNNVSFEIQWMLTILSNALMYLVLYVFDRPLTPRFNWIMTPIFVLAIIYIISTHIKLPITVYILIGVLLLLIIVDNYALFIQGFKSQTLGLQDPEIWMQNFVSGLLRS